MEIDVRYDGPDLADVARLTGSPPRTRSFGCTPTPSGTVAFTGFLPGFGYLVGGDERLAVPRLDEARTSVPAGSVGLAGEFLPAPIPQGVPRRLAAPSAAPRRGSGGSGPGAARPAGARALGSRSSGPSRSRAALLRGRAGGSDHRPGPRSARVRLVGGRRGSGASWTPGPWEAGQPAGRQPGGGGGPGDHPRRAGAASWRPAGWVALTGGRVAADLDGRQVPMDMAVRVRARAGATGRIGDQRPPRVRGRARRHRRPAGAGQPLHRHPGPGRAAPAGGGGRPARRRPGRRRPVRTGGPHPAGRPRAGAAHGPRPPRRRASPPRRWAP